MTTAHRIRRPFETVMFRAGLAVFPRLPRRAVLGLAWLSGNLTYLVDRRSRRIGQANLDVAFGDTKSAKEKKAILRRSFITIVRTGLDFFWFGTRPAERLARYVEIDDSMKRLFCNKNQVCITAHFGNWEALGQVMAIQGFPLHSIAQPVKNPEVDRVLTARRETTGQVIVPREGALRKLLGVLRGGGKAAFLVDQNTRESEGGIWADFFGLPVPVTPGPAALAVKTGSEIVICFCAPQPGGRYRAYNSDILFPPADSGEAVTRDITQRILSAIEREVRSHPEHWLWMYKRWKKIKPGSDPTRYPWYSGKS